MRIGPEVDTFDVLGVPVSITTPIEASKNIQRWSKDRKGRFVCLRDVHGIMQSRANPQLMDIHHNAAMVTPDGMPLVFLGKLRGHRLEQTCGANLLDQVLLDSQNSGLKHYFYGGKEGVVEELKNVLIRNYPWLKIVGIGTPPFRPLTEKELVELTSDIEESGADVVWIGLSTPKQEFLMQEMVKRTGATFLGIGAVYDFVTGKVPRAPIWMQRLGMEWAFRLACEPRRLWRRYLVMAPKFLWAIATEKSTARTQRF